MPLNDEIIPLTLMNNRRIILQFYLLWIYIWCITSYELFVVFWFLEDSFLHICFWMLCDKDKASSSKVDVVMHMRKHFMSYLNRLRLRRGESSGKIILWKLLWVVSRRTKLFVPRRANFIMNSPTRNLEN